MQFSELLNFKAIRWFVSSAQWSLHGESRHALITCVSLHKQLLSSERCSAKFRIASWASLDKSQFVYLFICPIRRRRAVDSPLIGTVHKIITKGRSVRGCDNFNHQLLNAHPASRNRRRERTQMQTHSAILFIYFRAVRGKRSVRRRPRGSKCSRCVAISEKQQNASSATRSRRETNFSFISTHNQAARQAARAR
jgi:hypothetical protein